MHIDSFKEHFKIIADQRQSAKVTYPLFDVLFGSLCAVIAGAKGWFDIREYIQGHHHWFQKNDMFMVDIPADDTIARIISTIEPVQFHECFLNWMQSVHTLTEGQVIAIDGKTLRGSYNREDRASTIHMISAYASSNKLVLGQIKTDQKSNEITAIPELLKMLDLRGALVTIDAMACQTKIAKAIVNQDGDYLLAVKNNQGQLRKAVEKAFSHQRATTAQDIEFENGHGRVESRQCYVLNSDVLEGNFSRWTGLKNIIMVESFRYKKGKSIGLEYRYYISSKTLTAEQAANAVREHWGIESMHWILDVSMNEDACQIYKDNGAENLSCLRHMALNMLRVEPTKVSIVGKQKRCLMNISMLENVLIAGLSKN
ncbi:ISAs1-like element ISVsa13 family transposase [Aliivibrio salmonicida]|uniref:Transposase n=1 Tax=Aliivibrio salmonicida (strain LFI1238) TaxID=316275 RepID=B6EHB7_ALISL|nr:ISAs1-like element ISVsa13 family transposase [Aliivibrio salmonicida]AZL84935.1 ISAs1-like element ISVsa13 family transposase [Aliivibrio salmonicida]AZL86070.1 ISAs1-like element ISVsa13 family transposase [Aliivibrio salmonicida]CAQ80693.1 transposase [Aliivibrio salmonicida LFI1238]